MEFQILNRFNGHLFILFTIEMIKLIIIWFIFSVNYIINNWFFLPPLVSIPN